MTVGGTVPATLSLTLGAPAQFGAFTPGVAKEYVAASTATVASTAGDATLSSPTRARPRPATWSTARSRSRSRCRRRPTAARFAPIGAASAPTTLLTYSAPVSNDP